MRFLIFLACLILLMQSCSKNSDPVIPTSPTDLVALAISEGEINLSWTDNSNNETGFKIERKTGSEDYSIINEVGEGQIIFHDAGLTSNTIYFYRVYSFNSTGRSINSSNQAEDTTYGVPILETTAADLIKANSAQSGGNIIFEGGSPITSSGLVWDVNPSPPISLPSKEVNGTNAKTFKLNISNILPNTKYYVRAFAINKYGTGYGNDISFTSSMVLADIDGNEYSPIQIGTQIWMKENLRTTKYNNGDVIANVTDNTEWSILSTGAWCYNSNDDQFNVPYGKLYNWFAASDPRNVCPTGWHVPSTEDWGIMIAFLGGAGVAGGKLKETGTTHWKLPNTGATNTSDFTGLPGGLRQDVGNFESNKERGLWWTSTNGPKAIELNYGGFNDGNSIWTGLGLTKMGMSIRCIKD